MNPRWLRLDLLVALIGFAYFFIRAEFPWHFAMLAGLAVGVASFATRRTVHQLRGLHAPRRGEFPEDEVEASSSSSPSDSAGS